MGGIAATHKIKKCCNRSVQIFKMAKTEFLKQNFVGGIGAKCRLRFAKSFCSDIRDDHNGSHLEILQIISPLEPYVGLNINLSGVNWGNMTIQNF